MAQVGAVPFWAATALVLGACQRTDALPPPPELGASMILLVLEGQDFKEAHAVEGGGPMPALALSGTEVLYAAIYDRSLADLGLLDGEILRGQPGEEPDRPARTYSMRVQSGEWVTEAEPPVQLGELRLTPAPATCDDYARYERSEETLGGSEVEGPCFVTSTSEGIYAGNPGGVWYVPAEGGSPHRDVPPSVSIPGLSVTSSTPILAIHRHHDQGYLMVQRGGLLSVGRFTTEQGLVRIGQLPDAIPAKGAWIAGSPAFFAGAPDAYILDSRGGLWHYAREEMIPILPPDPDVDFGENGGLVWLATGTAYALGPRGGQLLRLRDETWSQELLPQSARPSTLAYSPSLGVAVGDLEGRVWISTPEGWTGIDAPLMRPVAFIGEFDDGILYGGRQGVLAFYRENWPCHEGFTAPSQVFGVSVRARSRVLRVFSSSGIGGDAGPITITTFRR